MQKSKKKGVCRREEAEKVHQQGRSVIADNTLGKSDGVANYR